MNQKTTSQKRTLSSLLIAFICTILLNSTQAERQERILDPYGDYVLGWESDPITKKIVFDVNVRTNGFVGFGLNTQASMIGADIVIGGFRENGEPYLEDRYATASSEPLMDVEQNWHLLDSSRNGTHTYLKFFRHLDTCDAHGRDFVINDDTLSAIYAFGDSAQLIYHFTNRGGRQLNLLDPPQAHIEFDEEMTWKVRVNDTMPDMRTSYLCTIHKVKKFDEPRHLVALEVFLENPAAILHTHHFVATVCDSDGNQEIEDIIVGLNAKPGMHCEEMEMMIIRQYCTDVVFGWGTGGERVVLPDHVGISVGEPSDLKDQYLMFEVHYDNPNSAAGIQFTTGFNTFYTDKLRPQEGAVMIVGKKEVQPSLIIPPKSTNFIISGHCSSEISQQFLPPGGVKVVSVTLHSHLAGRKMRLRHFRNGTELPWVLTDENYNFDFQQTRQLRQEIDFLPGDHMTVECNFDNTWKDGVTVAGEGTEDEMCHAFVLYYPKIDLRACTSYYPIEELSGMFGIEELTQRAFNPVVVLPESLKGQRFSDVLDANPWTAATRQKVQEVLWKGVHETAYIHADTRMTKAQEQQIRKSYTSYPVVAEEYKLPASLCSGRASSAMMTYSNYWNLLVFIGIGLYLW